jgi:hypothetical protein
MRYDTYAVVHNLTVAKIHSYYVVAGGVAVLVHNCPGDEVAGAVEDTVRMRHYTNSAGKRGISESGVFMVRAKGKPMSPRDAESTLGIRRGHGRHVVEFDVPAKNVSSQYNPIMGITEWVHRGDATVSNIRVVR